MISKISLDMIKYFGSDTKRINHALKVHSFARIIGIEEKLPEEELFILEISALLHDIGIKNAEKKYNSSSGKYQEIEGPIVAKEILKKYPITTEQLSRILFLIGNHHTYTAIDNLFFQILIEADLIVNTDEDNLDIDTIKNLYNNYFITKTGKDIIRDINNM